MPKALLFVSAGGDHDRAVNEPNAGDIPAVTVGASRHAAYAAPIKRLDDRAVGVSPLGFPRPWLAAPPHGVQIARSGALTRARAGGWWVSGRHRRGRWRRCRWRA